MKKPAAGRRHRLGPGARTLPGIQSDPTGSIGDPASFTFELHSPFSGIDQILEVPMEETQFFSVDESPSNVAVPAGVGSTPSRQPSPTRDAPATADSSGRAPSPASMSSSLGLIGAPPPSAVRGATAASVFFFLKKSGLFQSRSDVITICLKQPVPQSPAAKLSVITN